jgi:hypothetical protein
MYDFIVLFFAARRAFARTAGKRMAYKAAHMPIESAEPGTPLVEHLR